MKKVLQISNYLYPHIGGIEQVARDIANALSEDESIEQKIICFNETAADASFSCLRKETVCHSVDGVDVIRCGCITKKASQSISLTFPSELKKIMDRFQPDIVVFHYPNPYQAQFLLKYLKRDIKFVLYWHLDITKQKLLGKIFHGQTMALLKRADTIVATSPLYVEGSSYLSRFKHKCIVIPNSINEARMSVNEAILEKAAAIRRENVGKFICFGVGRHIPYKGFTYLIKASKNLDERFRIYIGGKGDLTEKLKQEAGEDEKVCFLGRVSEEDLIAYYLAMDIFCFPSITKNEAFGIALAEGMYFEKPAVTFHIPGSGVNYVNLDGVTGIECPNCDSTAYAEAITKLAEDLDMREKMGKAARQRVIENFTGVQFKKNIMAFIETL